MIACPQCGKLNPENFNYCLDCGGELHPETTHSAESQFFIDLSADSPEDKKAKEKAEQANAKAEDVPALDIEDNALSNNEPDAELNEMPSGFDVALPIEAKPDVSGQNDIGNDEFSLDSLDDSVDELVSDSVAEESVPPEPVGSPKSGKPGDMVLELSPDDLEDAIEVPIVNKGLAVVLDENKHDQLKTEVSSKEEELDENVSIDSLDDFDDDIKEVETEELIDEFIAEPVVSEEPAISEEPVILDAPDSSLSNTIGFADVPEKLNDDSAAKLDLSASVEPEEVQAEPSLELTAEMDDDIDLMIDNNESDLTIDISQSAEITCAKCGASLKSTDRFCGQCGAPTEKSPADEDGGKTMFMHVGDDSVVENNYIGKLVIQEPSGKEGRSFSLISGENLCGRTTDPVLLDDTFVSPTHCSFIYDDGQMLVKDQGSLNGVFIKLKGEVELSSGTSFRIGQQLLMYVALDDFESTAEAIASDDTKFLGSPILNIWGKLLHINNDGKILASYILKEPKLVIGRENGDITFAQDGFVSGTHASLSFRDGKCYLKDLGSSNGSFYKVDQYQLKDDDLVLIGKKLMRYEILL